MTDAFDKFINYISKGTSSNPYTPEELKKIEVEQKKKEQQGKAAFFNPFASLFHYESKVIQNRVCPKNAELKILIDRANSHVKSATNHPAFKASKKLGLSIKVVDDLLASWGKIVNIESHINAGCEIAEAVTVLNKWLDDGVKGDNLAAAKAFDKFFNGMAKFVEDLPMPFNKAALFLSQIGIAKFFEGMADIGASRIGEGTLNNPTGKAMKEVLADLDAYGRGT